MVDSDTMNRILVEVTLGRQPARPDTEEEAAFRRKMEIQVAQIENEGYTVDIPGEIPDLD